MCVCVRGGNRDEYVWIIPKGPSGFLAWGLPPQEGESIKSTCHLPRFTFIVVFVVVVISVLLYEADYMA